MTRLLLGSVCFLSLTACPPTSTDGLEETGVDDCLATCEGTLVVQFADGRSEFQVQLTGDALSTLNLACPDNIAAGGPGEATCLADGFSVTAWSYVFPETLQLQVDEGDPISLEPEWAEETVCSTTCSSAEVVVE
ncbi:MAG: hypothetical protein VX519_03855 [Myxococcota bacterium]|nr:hypothetical protein [Myxococcota bacterium]